MKIGVITLFPKAFDWIRDPEASGLVGRAFENEKAHLYLEDLRVHGEGKHQLVDDTPYGGGDGMVLRPEPIEKALKALLIKMDLHSEDVKKVFLCPSGVLWNQELAESWAECSKKESGGALGVIFLCGRYAGADERVLAKLFDERISVGPFILNGGESAASCVIESLVRLLPGVLGNSDSVLKDSFSKGLEYKVEAPSYTKPRVWDGEEVPGVLLSGDHAKIKEYRASESDTKTKKWREEALSQISSMLGPDDQK